MEVKLLLLQLLRKWIVIIKNKINEHIILILVLQNSICAKFVRNEVFSRFIGTEEIDRSERLPHFHIINGLELVPTVPFDRVRRHVLSRQNDLS